MSKKAQDCRSALKRLNIWRLMPKQEKCQTEPKQKLKGTNVMNAKEILNQQFTKVKIGGYKLEEVD
ncbi:MAG: DivIVA domain-containing protein, partial [Oscillospiraceae bacterium]|nr:DivIVA domain-containing protein [Oscillospiraceae bacterium]